MVDLNDLLESSFRSKPLQTSEIFERILSAELAQMNDHSFLKGCSGQLLHRRDKGHSQPKTRRVSRFQEVVLEPVQNAVLRK